MLLIWRGWGLLAVLLPIVGVVLLGVAVDTLLGGGTWEQSPFFPGLGLVAAGLICVFVGRRLNGPPVPYTQAQADRPEGFHPRVPFLFAGNSFFFVPLEAWGVLWLAVGLVAMVREGFGI